MISNTLVGVKIILGKIVLWFLLVLTHDVTIAKLVLTLRLFKQRSVVFLVKVQSLSFLHVLGHLCGSVYHYWNRGLCGFRSC